jgi:hypothetical protein
LDARASPGREDAAVKRFLGGFLCGVAFMTGFALCIGVWSERAVFEAYHEANAENYALKKQNNLLVKENNNLVYQYNRLRRQGGKG